MKKIVRRLSIAVGILLVVWLVAEVAMRLYLETPLQTGFYSSLPAELVPDRQAAWGVQAASGPGWIHLGWIADPDREHYQVELWREGAWQLVGEAHFGSFLGREGGLFRVLALSDETGEVLRRIGEIEIDPQPAESRRFVPTVAGDWQTLYRPQKYGQYVNDHTIYQDTSSTWRLVGITSLSPEGDYNAEKYFTTASSASFPPADGMVEGEPVADFGELAWAPYVLPGPDMYHMFWSPHKLHQMSSPDGVRWDQHEITMPAPYHKFFRDAMVYSVADQQWLLYTTARGAYYSQVDIYQSFDLNEWQYIRTGLSSGWGSERNAPFASTESPTLIPYEGRYYLSITYNNDSYFWPGIFMLFHIWPGRASYNDTLVFDSDNPYDFGIYRGRDKTPNLVATLETHAPEYIQEPHTGAWYITTAGWPWVSSLTRGEVAVAPLAWTEARSAESE